MKRFLIVLALFLFACADLRAEEPKPRSLFVVETNEETASQSLERISGRYDLGFSTPSQTYESPSHYTPGPMGRQKAAEQTTDHY